MIEKKKLREKFLKIRNSIKNKEDKEKKICKFFEFFEFLKKKQFYQDIIQLEMK